MSIILKVFLDICLLRRGPQDLPSSGFLLGLALSAHALSVLLLSLTTHPLADAILAGVADTLVLALLTLSLLYLQKVPQRLYQTLSALAGTGALLGFLALPPSWWWFGAKASGADPSVPLLLLLTLIVWSIVVMAHIIRQALAAHMVVGLAVAGVFYWVAVAVRSNLFPLPQ